MGIVVDTCIWIELERGSLNPGRLESKVKDEALYLSPITIAEVSYSIGLADSESRAMTRRAFLNKLMRKPVLVIDEHTGLLFGNLLSSITKTPKQERHRTQDLWVASQCIQHGFSLLTRNVKDFVDIPGLKLIRV